MIASTFWWTKCPIFTITYITNGLIIISLWSNLQKITIRVSSRNFGSGWKGAWQLSAPGAMPLPISICIKLVFLSVTEVLHFYLYDFHIASLRDITSGVDWSHTSSTKNILSLPFFSFSFYPLFWGGGELPPLDETLTMHRHHSKINDPKKVLEKASVNRVNPIPKLIFWFCTPVSQDIWHHSKYPRKLCSLRLVTLTIHTDPGYLRSTPWTRHNYKSY